MSNRKPKSISLKPAGKGKPCDVVINGDLIVKKDVVAQCDVTVKKCLKVKNIVYNSETIDESGETLSNDKTLSWINTNGNGVLNDATKEGFYKKVVKINSAGGVTGWQSIQLNSDGITGVSSNTNINTIAFDSKENIYIGGKFTEVAGNTLLNGLAKWDVNAQSWTSVNGVNDIVQYDISSRAIQEIAIDSKDNVYIGGQFTSVDNNTDLNGLAKWNGSSWTSVNSIGDGITAGGDPYVNTIGFDKNNENTIYIGGAFTEVAGNNNLERLAKWDDDNKSWTSVNSSSDGVNSEVSSIALDSNNNLYIGGIFNQVDGKSNLQFLAKWDGSSWTSVNGINDGITGNGDDDVKTIVIDSSDNIYIGGNFEDVDSKGLISVAKWDGSVWTSIKPGGDIFFPAFVNKIAIDKDNENIIYVASSGIVDIGGGSFIENFLIYNGNGWTSLKSGGDNINNIVNEVTLDSKNNVYIGGFFTSVDNNNNLQRLAKYQQNIDTYELFFNSGTSVELTNKGDNACFIYNEFLNEWIKL